MIPNSLMVRLCLLITNNISPLHVCTLQAHLTKLRQKECVFQELLGFMCVQKAWKEIIPVIEVFNISHMPSRQYELTFGSILELVKDPTTSIQASYPYWCSYQFKQHLQFQQVFANRLAITRQHCHSFTKKPHRCNFLLTCNTRNKQFHRKQSTVARYPGKNPLRTFTTGYEVIGIHSINSKLSPGRKNVSQLGSLGNRILLA